MKTIRSCLFTFILLCCGFGAFCIRTQTSKINTTADNGGLTLPEGFSSVIVVDKLGSGRHIIVNSNGDVYLALPNPKNGKGIAALRDTTGDGKADIIQYFANTFTTCIDISDGYLYYSNFDQVLRVPLSEGELVPKAEPVVIATGFEEQTQHQPKTFALDNAGNLYVNVGAPSNACQETDRTPGSKGIDPCPQLE